jgi:hypothetical protein
MKSEQPPTSASASFLKKIITYIGHQDIKHQIYKEVLDPLLNHIMNRVFPYIILTCVLFVLLLLAVLLTLGIIVFQLRQRAPPLPGNLEIKA